MLTEEQNQNVILLYKEIEVEVEELEKRAMKIGREIRSLFLLFEQEGQKNVEAALRTMPPCCLPLWSQGREDLEEYQEEGST